MINSAVERFGRVDTLVNNAGVFVAKPFTEYTEADYNHMLGVNLAGFFHVTQRAIRQMLKQGGGHVINITTTLVHQPVKGVPSALASLTKGGIDAATRSLAIEYAEFHDLPNIWVVGWSFGTDLAIKYAHDPVVVGAILLSPPLRFSTDEDLAVWREMVFTIEDPELVRRLADSGVCLDVCPSSNVLLSVVPDIASHPLPALLDAGVRCSLNADDPLLFGPGLLEEYDLCRAEIFFETLKLGRARNRNDPGLLGKEPRQRDLCRCGVLCCGERGDDVFQLCARIKHLA